MQFKQCCNFTVNFTDEEIRARGPRIKNAAKHIFEHNLKCHHVTMSVKMHFSAHPFFNLYRTLQTACKKRLSFNSFLCLFLCPFYCF